MSSPAQVWSYRTLIANLARRDLKARYKKSLLGWVWSLLNPAATLGTYTLVFGVFLKGQAPGLGDGQHPGGIFALYLFCGLIVWNLFSGIINTSITSFQSAGPLLTRTYFPPECPIVASVANVVLQAFIEIGILMVIMVIITNVAWTALLLVPIVVLTTCFAAGLGLILAVLNIRYRDVAYLVGILLQVWFYATPIVYQLEVVTGIARRALDANPMTSFVYAVRQVTYSLAAPTLMNWIVMVVSAVVSLLLGWWTFSRLAPQVIEEL